MQFVTGISGNTQSNSYATIECVWDFQIMNLGILINMLYFYFTKLNHFISSVVQWVVYMSIWVVGSFESEVGGLSDCRRFPNVGKRLDFFCFKAWYPWFYHNKNHAASLGRVDAADFDLIPCRCPCVTFLTATIFLCHYCWSSYPLWCHKSKTSRLKNGQFIVFFVVSKWVL